MSNNKQQTAVEWLYLQMKKYCDDSNVPNDLLEQAKEMEKERIVKAVNKGWKYNEDGFVSWMGEQYYNEIYGGNK
jgi:hypothetical protein